MRWLLSVAAVLVTPLVASAGTASDPAFLGITMDNPPGGGYCSVRSVTPLSPAAEAGIQFGDFIVAMDGQPLSGPQPCTMLTSQIVSLPLPAPASGFTYEFDPALGVFTRSTSTFGPILAERADTIGARRVSIGFAYQRLAFDSIEGMDLQSIPAVFTHDNAELRGGREDVITTVNSIDSEVTRSAGFITYGVTDRLVGIELEADGRRLVLPSFGAYTGGLDVFDRTFQALFPAGFRVLLLGRGRAYDLPWQRLAPWA